MAHVSRRPNRRDPLEHDLINIHDREAVMAALREQCAPEVERQVQRGEIDEDSRLHVWGELTARAAAAANRRYLRLTNASKYMPHQGARECARRRGAVA